MLCSDIEKSFSSFKNIKAAKGRGEIIEFNTQNKNIVVIDDTYNANLASMKAGIQYLCDLKKTLHKKRAVAILGDIFELGDKSAKIHDEVLHFAKEKMVDFVIVAGDEMKKAAKILDSNLQKSYLNSIEISRHIKQFVEDGDILLVKGSRGMKMENVIDGLK